MFNPILYFISYHNIVIVYKKTWLLPICNCYSNSFLVCFHLQ